MNDTTIEIFLPGFRKQLLIDSQDYELVVRNSWIEHFSRGRITSIKSSNRYILNKGFNTMYLSRIINNTNSGFLTDHVKGDIYDNRRYNLRSCTASQNNLNLHKQKKRSLKYKGIEQVQYGKFRSTIRYKGKSYHSPCVSTQEEAAKYYDNFAKTFHGEFAKLNFPNIT